VLPPTKQAASAPLLHNAVKVPLEASPGLALGTPIESAARRRMNATADLPPRVRFFTHHSVASRHPIINAEFAPKQTAVRIYIHR